MLDLHTNSQLAIRRVVGLNIEESWQRALNYWATWWRADYSVYFIWKKGEEHLGGDAASTLWPYVPFFIKPSRFPDSNSLVHSNHVHRGTPWTLLLRFHSSTAQSSNYYWITEWALIYFLAFRLHLYIWSTSLRFILLNLAHFWAHKLITWTWFQWSVFVFLCWFFSSASAWTSRMLFSAAQNWLQETLSCWYIIPSWWSLRRWRHVLLCVAD